jgi:hypothetical protein
MSQEEFLLSQEETSCLTKNYLKNDIEMNEHNAEEEMEITLKCLQNL